MESATPFSDSLDALEDRGVPQDPQIRLPAEDARLRTAERLVNLIALFRILSWRLFWMAMINRAAPQASPRLALDDEEIALLDRLRPARATQDDPVASLGVYLTWIARLGGYLARAHDSPPGNTELLPVPWTRS